MLLGDSVELECNEYSANAESIPLNWDIELPKIWIPCSLLPNRKKSINPNENKPFIFYTLEKPDVSKSFSIYADEYSQHHELQTSSSVSSEISYKLKNNIDKNQVQYVSPSSENAIEWNTRLIISNKEGSSPSNPVINYEIDYSLNDEIHNSVIRDVVPREENIPDNCSMPDTSIKASFHDLTCRMTEILSEDGPLKTDWHHEDVIETNQISSGSALCSLSSSMQDSLEELYYSEEDENQFDNKYESGNLKSETSEKKHTCSIYTDNSYYIEVQKQLSESFENNLKDLKQAKNYDETVCKLYKESEDIPENQIDNVFNQTEHVDLNQIETSVHSQNLDQEQLNCEKLEDPTEKIVEFPIAYKRPPLQEHANKTKSQKEKKKTKRSKINIPLVDLFQNEEIDRFKVPEVDEFYENLIRQGKCQPLNQEIEIDAISSINFPGIPQSTLFWDSTDKFIQSHYSKPQSSSSQEAIKNEEKTELQLESNVLFDIIIIDNIPLYVTKENIESFILGFGELKNLTLEQHGKFQRAKLQMDFNCEIDWIIDCINDSQPFESINTELIKCYRQT